MRRFLAIASAVLATSLGSFATTANADSVEPDAPDEPARPKVVLLVSVSAPSGVAASFGAGGTDEISVRAILARAFGERGFTVVSAAGQKITRVATGEEAQEAGLADASAADLARKLDAGAAVIVSVEGQSDGAIRGTSLQGGVASARARLLDVASGRTIAEANGDGAGYGKDTSAAVEGAFRIAAKQFASVLAGKAAKAWPVDVVSSSGRTRIRIRGARSWGSVSAVVRRLATTRGVIAVHPESVAADNVRLAIETSLPTSKLISAIRSARLLNGSLSATPADGGIEVRVRGD